VDDFEISKIKILLTMTVPSKKKNVKPEKILGDIEKHLKSIAERKKEIENNFKSKLRELENQVKENEKWFKKEWEKLEKLENQLILWWDFWKREVKINSLREKTEIGTLPSEREVIMEEIQSLNAYNKTIEKGFKDGKIDVEIMEELRKELEKWMKEKNNPEEL